MISNFKNCTLLTHRIINHKKALTGGWDSHVNFHQPFILAYSAGILVFALGICKKALDSEAAIALGISNGPVPRIYGVSKAYHWESCLENIYNTLETMLYLYMGRVEFWDEIKLRNGIRVESWFLRCFMNSWKLIHDMFYEITVCVATKNSRLYSLEVKNGYWEYNIRISY